jgi:hypothetical protein
MLNTEIFKSYFFVWGNFFPVFLTYFPAIPAVNFLYNIPEAPRYQVVQVNKVGIPQKKNVRLPNSAAGHLVLNYLRNPSFSISARYL